ncbi:MAG: hypothetical protein RLZZ420_410 [Bacteroidota bacterium]|jgi:hypothetical protein
MLYYEYPRNENLLMQQKYSYQINSKNNVYMLKLGLIQDLYLEIITTGKKYSNYEYSVG